MQYNNKKHPVKTLGTPFPTLTAATLPLPSSIGFDGESVWDEDRSLLCLSCQCVLCNGGKCLFDIYSLLCTRLIVRDVILPCTPTLRLLGRHLTPVGQVRLVAQHHKRESRRIGGIRMNQELIYTCQQTIQEEEVGERWDELAVWAAWDASGIAGCRLHQITCECFALHSLM
jgi:hypothetical protein